MLGVALARATVATSRRLAAESRSWADALVVDETADIAHLSVSGPLRAIASARAAALELGAPALHGALEVEEQHCRRVAHGRLQAWDELADVDDDRRANGFLGGAPGFVMPRSQTPLRRFAAIESMPRFLSLRTRERVARWLRPIDIVRLLHTPKIERSGLVATLWLRAAIVIAAPIGGSVSVTGVVPLRGGASTIANAVFYLAAALALAVAITAPAVVARVMKSDASVTRRCLFVVEEIAGLALVATSPCWMAAAFLVGPINWLQRPNWQLAKLLGWGAVTFGVLVVAAAVGGHATIGQGALEALIAATAMTVIGCSYGLMLPAVASTLLTIAILDRRREHRAHADIARGRSQIIAALKASESALRSGMGGLGEAIASRDARRHAEDALTGLARERQQLEDGSTDVRAPTRTLVELCAQALTAVVPPVGVDEEAHLHSATIECLPPDIGRLIVARRHDAKALAALIRHLAYEAASRGDGLLYSRLRVEADGRIAMTLANEIASTASTGLGTGERWIDRKISALSGAELMQRDAVDGFEFGTQARVYTVTVALDRDIFASRE
jgi:hypothetical protein